MEILQKVKRKLKKVKAYIEDKTRRKTILIYCGVHNGGGFSELALQFDIAYGFDANPDKVKVMQEKFKDNKNVHIVHAALSDKDGETVTFNITENWDASSSIGKINPEYPHMKTTESPLYNTPVKEISVKTINLYQFCRKNGINYIDFLLTDLQGMDFTVLKTFKPFIDSKKIEMIECEVEKDNKPQIYIGIQSNKRKNFDELLSKNYEIEKVMGEETWWEDDIRWVLKKEYRKTSWLDSPSAAN